MFFENKSFLFVHGFHGKYGEKNFIFREIRSIRVLKNLRALGDGFQK